MGEAMPYLPNGLPAPPGMQEIELKDTSAHAALKAEDFAYYRALHSISYPPRFPVPPPLLQELLKVKRVTALSFQLATVAGVDPWPLLWTHGTHLTKLELHNLPNKRGSDATAALLTALASMPRLASLALHLSVQYQSIGINVLPLAAARTLTSLELSGLCITDSLLHDLSALRTLRTLRLSSMEGNTQGASPEIRQQLQTWPLVELSLSPWTGICPQAVEALAANTSLKSLGLANCWAEFCTIHSHNAVTP